MTTETRMAIGIPLTIFGSAFFIVFMSKGILYWFHYGYIAASVISLFAVFGGGVLVCPSNRKVGYLFATLPLVGVGFFGWLTWVGVSAIEVTMGFSCYLSLFCGPLAGVCLAIVINGLGMLAGRRILPRISKAVGDTTPQPPDEPGEG